MASPDVQRCSESQEVLVNISWGKVWNKTILLPCSWTDDHVCDLSQPDSSVLGYSDSSAQHSSRYSSCQSASDQHSDLRLQITGSHCWQHVTNESTSLPCPPVQLTSRKSPGSSSLGPVWVEVRFLCHSIFFFFDSLVSGSSYCWVTHTFISILIYRIIRSLNIVLVLIRSHLWSLSISRRHYFHKRHVRQECGIRVAS